MGKKKESTKEKIIPFGKNQRVIRPEGRGRRKLFPVRAVLMGLLAAACLSYCLCIFFFMGYGTKFFLIWGVLAVIFGLWTLCLCRPRLWKRVPRLLRGIFWTGLALGLVSFLAIEGMVLGGFRAHAEDGADYVIVLGAQWKKRGPSYVLQKRLDKALEYLERNPDTIVIVSGGQGSNEPVSEAEGMAGYLAAAGIGESRIIREDKSTDTDENLRFSSVFLEKDRDRVVLVSNNFHMFRALRLAKKQGYAKVEGLAADSYPAMLPNNLLREYFGVMKDFCFGNM